MPKHGKKFTDARSRVEKRLHGLAEAVQKIKDVKFAGFDETLEISIKLGVDPKHADQMVRGTVVLPHGTGRDKRVLVIAAGEKIKEAEEAGADFVGGAEMAKKIQEGWLDFDAVISTPDMMREVGKLGRILGPRGLMPNPKTGTVTFDVTNAVKEIKAGKVEFRVDKTAIIHVPLGKMSFEDSKLVENTETLISAILRAKPAAAKGKYVETVYLASTMGPGIALDPELIQKTGE
jgi:large subunit ribosomal protein L1